MLSVEEIKSYQRSCLVNFMKKNKLNSGLWSKKAGISEGTIRHYLSGRNSSITIANLGLLAQSVNVKISDLIDF